MIGRGLLEQHAAELAGHIRHEVTVVECSSQFLVTVHGAQLPAGTYSRDRSDVLLVSDVQYPMSAMDMFYMEPEVVLRDGRVPDYMSATEEFAGRTWRRWSWHRNNLWLPGVDNLISHWAFVEACWAKKSAA